MKKTNNINKNLDIKSFTDINYKSFPHSVSNNISTGVQHKNIDSSNKDMPNNYEEVNDYSFLNIITEEITNLEYVTDSTKLQEILTNSLVDNTSNLHKSLSEKDFNYLVKNLNNSDYKALLHNVNYMSYLEIIDSTNDNSYFLQLQDDGLYKLGDNNLDNLLTYLIESDTYKN